MTKLVYFGGQKGGSGKTTSTHLFCLGSILCGQPAAYVLTDPHRSPKADGRPYGVIDGRNPQTLAQIIETSQAAGNGWLAIDGGGNRQAFDEEMSRLCGLCIIPFNDHEESLEAAAKDLGRLERAFALPTAWPANSKAQESSRRFIDALESAFPGHVIPTLSPFVHSVNELTGHSLGNPSTPVRSLARKVFEVVADLYSQQQPVGATIGVAA